MSTIKQLTADLATGPCPSSKDLQALCTALHATMVRNDVPELLWLSTSFEDMADALVQAADCASPTMEDLAALQDTRRRMHIDREAEAHFEGVATCEL